MQGALMAESAKPGSEEFGDLLRQARERLGMSRRDLAEATGLSYPYISQIETGYRMPSSPAVRSLADALGLRVEHLFGATPPTTRVRLRSSTRRPPPEVAGGWPTPATCRRRPGPRSRPMRHHRSTRRE